MMTAFGRTVLAALAGGAALEPKDRGRYQARGVPRGIGQMDLARLQHAGYLTAALTLTPAGQRAGERERERVGLPPRAPGMDAEARERAHTVVTVEEPADTACTRCGAHINGGRYCDDCVSVVRGMIAEMACV